MHHQNIWLHKTPYDKHFEGRKKKRQSMVRFTSLISHGSRVDERHCDVAGAVGGGEAFVEVSQSTGVHEAPAFPGRLYGTVIPVESAASALKVFVFVIEGDIDGEGRGVVVGPQVRLPARCIFYHKVHYSVTLCVIAGEHF